MKKFLFVVFATYLWIIKGQVAALAQSQPNLGIEAAQSYSSTAIDHVNLLSGNVTHTIPLASFPQKGNLPPINFSYTYNSNPWYRMATCDSYSEECYVYYTNSAAPVASLSSYLNVAAAYPNSSITDNYVAMSPNLSSQLVYDSGDVCDSPDPEILIECVAHLGQVGVLVDYIRTLSVSDETGAQHELLFDTANPNWARAWDGSGYAMYAPGNYNAYTFFNGGPATIMGTLYDKSGNYVQMQLSPPTETFSETTTPFLIDLYGNKVNLVSSPQLEVVDSVGRTFLPLSGGQAGTQYLSKCPSIGTALQPLIYAQKWSLPGLNGATQDYILCYTGFGVHPGFFDFGSPSATHCDDILYNLAGVQTNPPDEQYAIVDGSEPYQSPLPCVQEFGMTPLQSIVLPNGTYWGFSYDAGQGSQCDDLDGSCITPSYGTIQSVTLPTGGTISYQYADFPSITDLTYLMSYRVATQRTVTDNSGSASVTKYSYVIASTPDATPSTVVTDPLGNDVVHTFSFSTTPPPQGLAPLPNDPYAIQMAHLETQTNYYQGLSTNAAPILLATDTTSYTDGTSGLPQSVSRYEGNTLVGTTTYGYATYGGSAFYDCSSRDISYCTASPASTIQRQEPTGITVANGDGYITSQIINTPLDVMQSTYAAENVLDKTYKTQVFENSSSVVSETDYGFDETTPANTPMPAALTSISSPLSTSIVVKRTFSYNADGSLSDTTSASGTITHVNTYQCDNLYPASVTLAYQSVTPLPETYSSIFDCGTGKQTSVTDVNGVVTNFEYDSLLRPTTVKRAVGTGAESWTAYSYPSMNEVDVAQDQNTKGDGLLKSSSLTDGIGHVTHITAPGNVQQDLHFNALGSLDWESNPYVLTSDQTYGKTYLTYDALGRMTQETKPGGAVLTWCYQGIASTGQSMCRNNLSSFASGSWVDSSDEAGNLLQTVSNAAARKVRVVESGGLETRYSYTAMGNITEVHQSGNGTSDSPRIRKFLYDPLSRLVAACNPEGLPSGTNCDGAHWSETYDYDLNSNILNKTDSRNLTKHYSYDALDRVLSITYPNETIPNTTPPSYYGYDGFQTDNATPTFYPNNNSIGRLTSMSSSPQTGYMSGTPVQHMWNGNWFTYDPMGRIAGKGVCLNNDCSYGSGMNQAYDLAGNLVFQTHPNGRAFTQSYDGAGRLQTVNEINNNTGATIANFVSSVSYYPDGSEQSMTLGSGITQTIGKNSRLQVSQIQNSTQLGTTTIAVLNRQYSYGGCTAGGSGNNGNICAITDQQNPGRSQSFTYDSLNRISSFTYGGVPYQQYSIDSFGNMTGMNGSTPLLNFNPANQIMNMSQLVSNGQCNGSGSATSCMPCPQPYDAAGNVLCGSDQNGGPLNYSYDAEGRMNAITNNYGPVETYTYAADGSRAVKFGPTWSPANDSDEEAYVEWDGQPVAELSSTGWTDYIVANGRRIARLGSTEVLHQYGVCPTTDWCPSHNFTVSSLATNLTTYTIRNGDKLVFLQEQTNAASGLFLFATDGTNSAGTLFDQNNDGINSSSAADGVWNARTVDMTSWEGKTISQNLGLSLESVGNSAASYDSQIADIELVSTDGSWIPIYNAQNFSGQVWSSGVNATFENLTTSALPVASHFFLQDHLGSASQEFSSGGWMTASTQFMPFGGEINPQGTTENHYKFTGKERDTESGLDNFEARYYGSSMGRFMSPDPSSLVFADPTNPQSFNLYSYVLNNPLVNVDPNGLDCVHINNDTGAFISANRGDCDNSTEESANTGHYYDGHLDTLYTSDGTKNGTVTGFGGTDENGGYLFSGVPGAGTSQGAGTPITAVDAPSDQLSPYAQAVFGQVAQRTAWVPAVCSVGAYAQLGGGAGAVGASYDSNSGGKGYGRVRPLPGDIAKQLSPFSGYVKGDSKGHYSGGVTIRDPETRLGGGVSINDQGTPTVSASWAPGPLTVGGTATLGTIGNPKCQPHP